MMVTSMDKLYLKFGIQNKTNSDANFSEENSHQLGRIIVDSFPKYVNKDVNGQSEKNIFLGGRPSYFKVNIDIKKTSQESVSQTESSILRRTPYSARRRKKEALRSKCSSNYQECPVSEYEQKRPDTKPNKKVKNIISIFENVGHTLRDRDRYRKTLVMTEN